MTTEVRLGTARITVLMSKHLPPNVLICGSEIFELLKAIPDAPNEEGWFTQEEREANVPTGRYLS